MGQKQTPFWHVPPFKHIKLPFKQGSKSFFFFFFSFFSKYSLIKKSCFAMEKFHPTPYGIQHKEEKQFLEHVYLDFMDPLSDLVWNMVLLLFGVKCIILVQVLFFFLFFFFFFPPFMFLSFFQLKNTPIQLTLKIPHLHTLLLLLVRLQLLQLLLQAKHLQLPTKEIPTVFFFFFSFFLFFFFFSFFLFFFLSFVYFLYFFFFCFFLHISSINHDFFIVKNKKIRIENRIGSRTRIIFIDINYSWAVVRVFQIEKNKGKKRSKKQKKKKKKKKKKRKKEKEKEKKKKKRKLLLSLS